MTRIATIGAALLALSLLLGGCGEADTGPIESTVDSTTSTSSPATVSPIAASGLPKLVDLGSDSCVPCQMMAPELEALAQEHAGALDVVVVDVNNTDEGAALAKELRIRVIPTQIWFGPDGKELFRHDGYISKEDIVTRFQWLGFPLAKVDAPTEQGTGSSGGGG
jgi:thioredoxin 1